MKTNKKWYEYIIGTPKYVKKVDKMSEREVKTLLRLRHIAHINLHYWSIYSQTKDKEDYFEIVEDRNLDLNVKNITYHAFCFDCEVFRGKYPRRNCLLCGYFPDDNGEMSHHENKQTPINRYTY